MYSYNQVTKRISQGGSELPTASSIHKPRFFVSLEILQRKRFALIINSYHDLENEIIVCLHAKLLSTFILTEFSIYKAKCYINSKVFIKRCNRRLLLSTPVFIRYVGARGHLFHGVVQNETILHLFYDIHRLSFTILSSNL